MIQHPLYEVDFYDTFPDYIAGIERRFGGDTALTCYARGGEEKNLTYTELCSRVRALREALISRGLGGRHIAIVGENSPEWLTAYLAIACTGGVSVCVDTEQTDESIREMICNSDSEAVFASSAYEHICRSLTQDGRIVLIGLDAASGAEITLEDLIAEGGGLPAGGDIAIDTNQAAAIVFTSGTTSTSKMVMLSHRNLLYNASVTVSQVELGMRVFTPLPFYHTYGLTCSVLANFVIGATVIINGNLRTMVRDLGLARATSFMAVPLMVETLYNQIWVAAKKNETTGQLQALLGRAKEMKKSGAAGILPELEALRREFLADLPVIISGGASIDNEICEMLELFGVVVLQGYGISECSPLVAVNRLVSYKHGAVGLAVKGLETRLVDEELWVRSPSVMLGYYKAPDLTDEAIEDGWFKTGDIGSIDRDGFIFITGRKKNLIVFKNGKKLSPEKLEGLFQTIPLVKEVVVHSAPAVDGSGDVRIIASIFPNTDMTGGMSSYEVLSAIQSEVDAINSALPSYQRIEMVNIRDREFAKTATKKTKRHLI